MVTRLEITDNPRMYSINAFNEVLEQCTNLYSAQSWLTFMYHTTGMLSNDRSRFIVNEIIQQEYIRKNNRQVSGQIDFNQSLRRIHDSYNGYIR